MADLGEVVFFGLLLAGGAYALKNQDKSPVATKPATGANLNVSASLVNPLQTRADSLNRYVMGLDPVLTVDATIPSIGGSTVKPTTVATTTYLTPEGAYSLIQQGQYSLVRSKYVNSSFSWGEFFGDRNAQQAKEATVTMLQAGKRALDGLSKLKQEKFGNRRVTITGGWRNMSAHLAIYKALGQPAPMGSRHLYGDGFDITVSGLSRNQLWTILDPIHNGGLGQYPDRPTVLHIDFRGSKARWYR